MRSAQGGAEVVSAGTRRGRAAGRRLTAAMTVLALTGAVGFAARSPRPPVRGDGIAITTVWLMAVVFVAALAVAVVAVLLTLRERLPGTHREASPARALRTLAFVMLAIWGLSQASVLAPTSSRSSLDAAKEAGGTTAAPETPFTTSPAAVGASLAAIALLGAAAALRGRRQTPAVEGPPRAPTGRRTAVESPVDPHGITDPRGAVLAAYAAARSLVAPLADTPNTTGPLALMRRLERADVGPDFAELTRRYLPARFGRSEVDDDDRRVALAALDRIRHRVQR